MRGEPLCATKVQQPAPISAQRSGTGAIDSKGQAACRVRDLVLGTARRGCWERDSTQELFTTTSWYVRRQLPQGLAAGTTPRRQRTGGRALRALRPSRRFTPSARFVLGAGPQAATLRMQWLHRARFGVCYRAAVPAAASKIATMAPRRHWNRRNHARRPRGSAPLIAPCSLVGRAWP